MKCQQFSTDTNVHVDKSYVSEVRRIDEETVSYTIEYNLDKIAIANYDNFDCINKVNMNTLF